MRGGVKNPILSGPPKKGVLSWFKRAPKAQAAAPAIAQADPRAAYKALIANQRATKAGQAYMSKTHAEGLPSLPNYYYKSRLR